MVWYYAKSLQSCPTLCDPIDGSPPGSPVLGILQARTLKWVAISFSNAWKWKVKVKSLSRVQLLATPWTAAHQAPPSMGFSRQEYWSCHCLLPTYFKEIGLPFWVPGVLCQCSEVVLWKLLNIQMIFWWICGGESGLPVLFLHHLGTASDVLHRRIDLIFRIFHTVEKLWNRYTVSQSPLLPYPLLGSLWFIQSSYSFLLYSLLLACTKHCLRY